MEFHPCRPEWWNTDLGANFGDCFAYALAAQTGEPLLYTGYDFGHTDIVAAG